jgi:RNA polymerase sigma-70 factor (ECF subfamily)
MVVLLPRLRRFAFALTGSVDEGDDLVQATYERALDRLGQWQNGSRLDSWMFRIAHNLHRNRERAARVRARHHGTAASEARMTLGAVQRFVRMLPAEQQTALVLVCVEGLSYKEAVHVLDLPMGTLTSWLGCARIAFANGPPPESAEGGG